MSVQHHRSILSANFFGNGTWEALKDKEAYLKSDRGAQLENPAGNKETDGNERYPKRI